MRRIVTVVLAALWITGCAPEVVRRPSQLTLRTEGSGGTIEILQDKPITVGPGYRRVITRGSVWARVGHTGEGEVYKPVGGVFTVEGAQVHEAYLVIDGDRVVGFYLPVERAFSAASVGEDTKLSFQRR
jgi:hypothetical protein